MPFRSKRTKTAKRRYKSPYTVKITDWQRLEREIERRKHGTMENTIRPCVTVLFYLWNVSRWRKKNTHPHYTSRNVNQPWKPIGKTLDDLKSQSSATTTPGSNCFGSKKINDFWREIGIIARKKKINRFPTLYNIITIVKLRVYVYRCQFKRLRYNDGRLRMCNYTWVPWLIVCNPVYDYHGWIVITYETMISLDRLSVWIK